MRYSYEYKLKCIEMYRNGKWAETPEGVNQDRFRHNIRQWVRMEEHCGAEVLKHKKCNKTWTVEEKYELVARVIAGNTKTQVALNAGINPGMLYQWVQKYKHQGYNGLIEQKKGRPCKNTMITKKEKIKPLTESEREELIRLRAEIEKIKAENEIIKKEIALREERCAAQLKAKKQRLSKSLKKKDIN